MARQVAILEIMLEIRKLNNLKKLAPAAKYSNLQVKVLARATF